MSMWAMIAVVSVTYTLANVFKIYMKNKEGSVLPPDPELRARLDRLERRMEAFEPRLDNLETLASDREVDLARRIAERE
ncbi:MAG: hypothetical protein KDC35_19160 [Acidobacteria bacterium]|nr:hypothetical protein [Acidobacteriota bacterium]